MHPSADVLKAFGLGELDESSSGVGMEHLDKCEDCHKVAAAVSGEDFPNRLRQAHGHSSTPAPAKSLAEAAQGLHSPRESTTRSNLPPELADHPDYEVLRELRRGGMGVVYLAQHRLSHRVEVLKVMNKELLGQSESRERFLREIRSAAQFDHKNVVKMYNAQERGELMVLVMEYVPGEDLAQVVRTGGPLRVSDACSYVQQAASGLQHAFEKGIVHRDINPRNLILAREGSEHIVKILDFGLVKATHGEDMSKGLTNLGAMMGTPAYIAPEQSLDAATADIRADIYSLGCTLYHLLAGKPPFSGKSVFEIVQAHHIAEARPLNQVRWEVPKELAAVVRKMMAKDAAQRYQTPAEVVRALDLFVKGSPKPLSPPPAPPNTGQRDAASPPMIPGSKIEGPAIIDKGSLRPSSRKPAPLKGGQRDAGSLRVNPKGMIEGRAMIAKAKSTPWRKRSRKRLFVPLSMLLLVGLLSFWAPHMLREKTPAEKPAPSAHSITNQRTEKQEKDLTPGGKPAPSPNSQTNQRTENQVKEPTPKPKPAKLPGSIANSIGMELVLVKPGTFLMGSSSDEQDRVTDEEQHEIEITQPFYAGIHEVTREQYECVMRKNPSCFSSTGSDKDEVKGVDTRQFPVENVSWDEAMEFCLRLSELPEEKAKGHSYRLPTEAEWEYCCRGGHLFKSPSPTFHFGNSLTSAQANFDGNNPYGGAAEEQSLHRPTKVGSYPPNSLGLYDLHGNVSEWCADWYDSKYYGRSPRQNPQGPEKEVFRVTRGGSWCNMGTNCRSACRNIDLPSSRSGKIGFRVVLVVGARN
jgi:serine/threonine protein kinase/formylglycine-generating enzyme required for sulfatase activity